LLYCQTISNNIKILTYIINLSNIISGNEKLAINMDTGMVFKKMILVIEKILK